MIKKTVYILTVFTLIFCSCKKTRVCECKNSNGTYDAGEIDATKFGAKKYCKDLSDGATECYLKK